MINLFLEQIMGNGGLAHIQTLLKYVKSYEDGTADKGLAMRAETLTYDRKIPSLMREFFSEVAKQQHLSHSQGTLFRGLQQNLANLRVLNNLNLLKIRVLKEDAELCHFLQDIRQILRLSQG